MSLGVGNGDPWLGTCCFSSMASAFFKNCSTCSTRLVFFPPRQMKTAAAIAQRKLAGIKIPVDHGGRSNLRAHNLSHRYGSAGTLLQYLSRPHIVPHKITWKMELPSIRKHMIKAVLLKNISQLLSAWSTREAPLT